MKQKTKKFISAFVMGCAQTVPGADGSTVALMLGIYDDYVNLLFSVSEIFKTLAQVPSKRKNLRDVWQLVKNFNYSFALFLGLGITIAITLLSNLIVSLLGTSPQYLSAVLLGLVFSVVVIPLKIIRKPNRNEVLIAIVSFIFFFIFLGLSPANNSSVDPTYLQLFLGGLAAIAAMMLPGVGGSYVLLVLGLYYYILGSIGDIIRMQASIYQIMGLVVFVLGMITGILTITRLFKNALEKHLNLFLAFVTGLLLASSRVLWPFVETIEVNGEKVTTAVPLTNFQPSEIALTIGLFVLTLVVFSIINWKHAEI